MFIDFTVAIPTYNGENRLPEVLEKLRAQVQYEPMQWEIIIVDNNSIDNTAKVVQDYQGNWNHPYVLRYCFEPEQGAFFARKLAIKESNAALIGFLDDDNLPALNWVAEAYTFAKEHPRAGAYGSQIHGQYEVEPPDNFERIKAFFAITERGNQPLLYNPKLKFLPPSAGLVVQKEAWLESVPEHCILTGRVQGKMLTGEDLEALAYIQHTGWEIWYNPAMEVVHKIPASRLTRDYLISFMRGIGLSRYVTRMVGVKPEIKLFFFLAYFVNDLRKIIIHVLKYGATVKTDLVTACEMEIFVNSLISPFYLWYNGYLK